MSAVRSQVLAQSPDTDMIKRWIAHHPVVAYFVLANFLTWMCQLPMVLGQNGLGIFAFSVPVPVYILLFIASSYTGPTGAAFYVTFVIEGKEGMHRFMRRYGEWRIGIQWYLFAFFAFPLIYLVSAGIFLDGEVVSALAARGHVFFTTYLPALLIFPAIITWGEEPGWRGFALIRMQERFSPLLASLVVGLMHGLWHLPVYIIVNGPPAMGPFNITRLALNTFGIMMITIIWTWVFNNSKQSILMAVLLHASSNASSIFIHALLPNFPKQAGYATIVIYAILAITLVIATKGDLSYHQSGMET